MTNDLVDLLYKTISVLERLGAIDGHEGEPLEAEPVGQLLHFSTASLAAPCPRTRRSIEIS